MSWAAFNTGPDFHLLDHIAPLADLLSIPLIVTEEKNFDLAQTFYPNVKPRFQPDLEFELGSIAEEFDALFECKYWQLHLKRLFFDLYKKEMDLVFCPHGQSDKGYRAPLLAPYANQDLVLIYGDLLSQMLKDLGIEVKQKAMVGNYRLNYYLKHRFFYDQIAEEKIFSHLSPHKKTLLYAPTWRDADQSTSFFAQGSRVVDSSDWNLIVKIHPLLEMRNPELFYRIASKIEQRANTILVSEFPPVYPILFRVDAFLGDASSVGYDFLATEKPLFFFPGELLRLHTCGQKVPENGSIYSFIERNERVDFSQKRKELYKLAFSTLQKGEGQIRLKGRSMSLQ